MYLLLPSVPNHFAIGAAIGIAIVFVLALCATLYRCVINRRLDARNHDPAYIEQAHGYFQPRSARAQIRKIVARPWRTRYRESRGSAGSQSGIELNSLPSTRERKDSGWNEASGNNDRCAMGMSRNQHTAANQQAIESRADIQSPPPAYVSEQPLYRGNVFERADRLQSQSGLWTRRRNSSAGGQASTVMAGADAGGRSSEQIEAAMDPPPSYRTLSV